MTYMCPFCHHQQGERTFCIECGFDLTSNHYNPVCSKCEIKFISMEELKTHFKTCKLQIKDHFQDMLGKCIQCGLNFYSESMFDIHFSKMHRQCKKVEVLSRTKGTCDICNVDSKCKKCDHNAKPVTANTLKEQYGNHKKYHEQVNLWQCNYCSLVFTQHSLYQEHKTKNMCHDKILTCPKCKLKFANKHTKEKHVLENACGNEKYTKCYFEDCDVRCLRRIQLNQHIKECHGLDLKYEIKKFPSFNDFDLWKDDFGMNTMTFYSITARTKYQRNGKQIESITYGCSFDMQRAEYLRNKLSNRSNKKRKVKFEFNTSNICTARINVKVLSNQQVLASICAEHNHPLSIEHLKVQKLPKSRRDFLVKAFVMGANVEQVMDVLKQEAKALGIVTKESSLPRRFFKEIQRKSLLRYSADNDIQAVTQFVEELKTMDGVLIYKSGSEAFNVQEELPADIFMLGLQTQPMLQMLETHGQTVYIEGIHNLTRYPDYRLFNFLVTDGISNIFPVAHFITNAVTPEHLTLLFKSMKPRVEHFNVESIVVQSDQHLDVALSSLFNNKTIFINQWDLSCIDQPKKKMKGDQSFEYAVVVNDKDEQDLSTEQHIHSITHHTVTASDDCVLQFHRDLRSKFKRSHSMFILLNELITYFKKRYSSMFDLTPEDSAMPKYLKKMRQKLFEYKVESQSDEEIKMFDENEEEADEILDREMSTLIKTESLDKNSNHSSEDLNMSYTDDTSCNKEILKEIIVANTAAAEDDDSSIHVLREYQKSIIELLEVNPIARPLIIKSVLEETKSLYEQVQACCNETTRLEWFPRREH